MAESAIDAISYLMLHQPGGCQLASTAGGWGPKTTELILAAMAGLESPATALLAFDHDEQGERHASKCQDAMTASGFQYARARPATQGTDWNDVLRGVTRA